MFTISMILQSPPVLVSFSEEVLVHMLEMDPKVVETQVIILNIIHMILEHIDSIPIEGLCQLGGWADRSRRLPADGPQVGQFFTATIYIC